MGIVNTDHIEGPEMDEIPSADSKASKGSFRCFCVKRNVQELQSGSHREEESCEGPQKPGGGGMSGSGQLWEMLLAGGPRKMRVEK